MDNNIFSENEKKRLDQPLWMLICFAMFSFWQMGFIYFIGPSLTIDGKTPLPIDMDNATSLIAVCYVISIFWMIFFPHTVVKTQRIATGIALASALCLFLPLPEETLRFIVYTQIFCCCLMIGFETFLIVNYLSERCTIKHLTAAYAVAYLLIALLQNEFYPITFPTFRFIMVGALILLLTFFLRMPTGQDSLPRYVKKSDALVAPKKMLLGTYILVFVAALMGVSGPAVVSDTTHGVFITNLVNAITSFCLYFLYKKAHFHPFRLIPALIGIAGLGYLFMFAATQVSSLEYIACVLIGFGLVPCQMLPLYGSVMMKAYPSRYISPMIIGLALIAVLVQSSMVEIFRTAPTMLYLVYAVTMAVLVFLYAQIEPFFLFTLRRRIPCGETVSAPEAVPAETSAADPLDVLSEREKQVAELICLGHTNNDIAKLLYISEHTVKDHTKKIYPKLGVHSRLELATLVSKSRLDK